MLSLLSEFRFGEVTLGEIENWPMAARPLRQTRRAETWAVMDGCCELQPVGPGRLHRGQLSIRKFQLS